MTLCYTVLILLLISFFLLRKKKLKVWSHVVKYLSLHVSESRCKGGKRKWLCKWMTVSCKNFFSLIFLPSLAFLLFSILLLMFHHFVLYCVCTNSKRVNKALTTLPKSKCISCSSSSCFSFFFFLLSKDKMNMYLWTQT
jgi:hypothetical protein